jgi:hypothetical protein
LKITIFFIFRFQKEWIDFLDHSGNLNSRFQEDVDSSIKQMNFLNIYYLFGEQHISLRQYTRLSIIASSDLLTFKRKINFLICFHSFE